MREYRTWDEIMSRRMARQSEELTFSSPPRNYKFRGWDWCEVLEALGYDTKQLGEICSHEYQEGNGCNWVMEALIDEALGQCTLNSPDVECSRLISALREYCKKLCSVSSHCSAPVWQGLSDVKDDFTFLQYCRILYQCMWD